MAGLAARALAIGMVVFAFGCTRLRPIVVGQRDGRCNDEGESCCGDPGYCDVSQGLGCDANTARCVPIRNDGPCDDEGEPCCARACDPYTHLECNVDNICVAPERTDQPCGNFGEDCCDTVDGGAAMQCNRGMHCTPLPDPGIRQCAWLGAGTSLVDVGWACGDGDCRDADLRCDGATHSCVVRADPMSSCGAFGQDCCDNAGTLVCEGFSLVCEGLHCARQ